MCGRQSRPRWPALWLSVLLASVSATLAAEDLGTQTSPPPSYEWPTLNPEPTTQTPGLMQLWSEYDQQFKSSMLTLEQFLDQVEAFGISFESLPGFMTHLVDSYRASELARIQERAESDKAIEAERSEARSQRQRADWWRWAAIIAGALAASGWAAFGVSMMF